MNRGIRIQLTVGIILIFSVVNLIAQDYFYDAKYIGERIYLTPSNDEILVKFSDTITEQALNALAQDMQLDIVAMDLAHLKYARMHVPNPEPI